MTIVLFILSITLLLVAAYVAAMNWGCVIVSMRNKRRGIDRHHSTVPVVSFLIAFVAAILYPRPNQAAWMLAVPLLDIAHWLLLLALLWLPVVSIREFRKKRKAEPGAGGDTR